MVAEDEKMYDNHNWLIVANPFPYGGGGKRAFEVLKNFSNFNITPILYTPYTDLLFSLALERAHYDKNAYTINNVLKELERSHVIIPPIYYKYVEKLEKLADYFNEKILFSPLKKGVFSALKYLKDSINFHRNVYFKNILHLNHFLREFQLNDIGIRNIDLVYSMHELPSTVAMGAFLAKTFHKSFYTLLQLEPFKSIKNFITEDYTFRIIFSREALSKELSRLFILILSSFFRNPKRAYEYANSLKVFRGILAVSSSPLITSGLDTWANKRGILVRILKPANSVNEKLAGYVIEKNRRHLISKKEDFAIFYARLNSSKGLIEIPYIAKKLERFGYKLIVAGRFDNIGDKDRFFKICEEKRVKNVEYVGYLPEDELFNLVSRAKVLVYPSHLDAFSLVILEALFLGCFVVAYDIPAIKSVYGGLKPVKLVREYDCREMVEMILKTLMISMKEYEEEHLDPLFLNFLKLHSSWRNVAKAEIETILEMMRSKNVVQST